RISADAANPLMKLHQRQTAAAEVEQVDGDVLRRGDAVADDRLQDLDCPRTVAELSIEDRANRAPGKPLRPAVLLGPRDMERAPLWHFHSWRCGGICSRSRRFLTFSNGFSFDFHDGLCHWLLRLSSGSYRQGCRS